jgi:hypothetical protein
MIPPFETREEKEWRTAEESPEESFSSSSLLFVLNKFTHEMWGRRKSIEKKTEKLNET